MDWNSIVSNPLYITPAAAVVSLVAGIVIGRLSANGFSGNANSGAEGEEFELYVGNLPYNIGEKELSKAIAKHGKVKSVRIIRNRGNGRSKGYGFVKMAGAGDAKSVIKNMHGKELKDRKLVINEAKSKPED